MADQPEVTVENGAESVVEPGQRLRSVQRGISNNGDAIAILAGAWYYKGKPGRGGERNRFAKTPITH